jgi:hypothetical protein
MLPKSLLCQVKLGFPDLSHLLSQDVVRTAFVMYLLSMPAGASPVDPDCPCSLDEDQISPSDSPEDDQLVNLVQIVSGVRNPEEMWVGNGKRVILAAHTVENTDIQDWTAEKVLLKNSCGENSKFSN